MSPAQSGEPGSAALEDNRNFALALSDEERSELDIQNLAGTVLRAPSGAPSLVHDGGAVLRDEPLLGLHNRDYVSIWALHRLARYTPQGPIGFEEYLDRVTKAAWFFGCRLGWLEHESPGRKLTVLFPTNLAKRPSAERGFQSFAVGSLTRPGRGDGVPTGAGPLFAWNAVQVSSEAELSLGLTASGSRLMQDLDGISLELPHSRSLATRFLAYLKEHAPGDRWGFDHVVRTASDTPGREELVHSFAKAHPEWSEATASSVAQGYVARAREWGLLESRLTEGRYWLTAAGRELVEKIDENPSAPPERKDLVE